MTLRVMVVDDSTTVRQQLGHALQSAGFDVIEAVDGQDAMDKVVANRDLAMVVCDVHMPRMDGLEFVRSMKGEPLYRDIPVVMLTTEGRPELIAQAKALGAKAWLVKPIADHLLVAAVEKLTRR